MEIFKTLFSTISRLNAAVSDFWHFIERNNLVIPFLVATAVLSIFFISLAALIYFDDENKISPSIESLMSEESEIAKKSLSRPLSQMPDIEVVKLTKLLVKVVYARGLPLDVDDENHKGVSKVDKLIDTTKADL